MRLGSGPSSDRSWLSPSPLGLLLCKAGAVTLAGDGDGGAGPRGAAASSVGWLRLFARQPGFDPHFQSRLTELQTPGKVGTSGTQS